MVLGLLGIALAFFSLGFALELAADYQPHPPVLGIVTSSHMAGWPLMWMGATIAVVSVLILVVRPLRRKRPALSLGEIGAIPAAPRGLGHPSALRKWWGSVPFSGEARSRSGDHRLREWASTEAARLGFTEAGAVEASVAGASWLRGAPNWDWRLDGEVLGRGAYQITRVPAGATLADPVVQDQKRRFESAINWHEAEMSVDAQVVGQQVLLSVTNRGASSDFAAQITCVAGIEEAMPLPLNLAWWQHGGEARRIHPRQSQLVSVADGDGMGEVKAQVWRPGIWTFHGAGGPVRVHMTQPWRSEDIYGNDVEVMVQVTRADTGRSVSVTLVLGFVNENLDRYDESRNLCPRADLRLRPPVGAPRTGAAEVAEPRLTVTTTLGLGPD